MATPTTTTIHVHNTIQQPNSNVVLMFLQPTTPSDNYLFSAWNVLNPGPAAELGTLKATNVLATEAQLLVTANPGCLMQVAAAVQRQGGRIGLAHTAQVLDASIRNLGSAALLRAD